MADSTVIADVGRTLIQLFRDNMVPDPILQPESIGLTSPAEKGDFALTLFLYQIDQNGISQQSLMMNRGPNSQQMPPMAVDLHYLITAHSTADAQTKGLDEHRILGRAIQVLYDNLQIRNSALQGSLADADEELRIQLLDQQLPMQTMTSLFPSMPYKLSFGFTVGPVFIDSGRTKPMNRILDRDTQFRG